MTDSDTRQPGYAKWLKLASILGILIAILLFMRLLPIKQGVDALEGWITSIGIWGPIAMIGIYIVACVFLLPGSALTLAAGAIFGLWKGTLVVWLGATLGVAAAFLVGRYLARSRVEKMAAESPKFSAIDKAIGKQGWKIVAMLRLSPLVPFNLQNYLYGLTSIGFWPCVLTSSLFMLPGTFLYVYLGAAAKEGIEAAAGGGEGGKTPAEWAILIVGLIATIAVTIFVTKIATRAVREQTDIDAGDDASKEENMTTESPDKPVATPWGAWAMAAVAIVLLAGCGYATAKPDPIRSFFSGLLGGTPAADLQETYEDKEDGRTFDHSAFNALLTAHVDEDGWVDYAAFNRQSSELDSYIDSLKSAPFDELTRDEKLALLINAYNAFTIRLILDNWDDGRIESIEDIPRADRWKAKRWNIAGKTYSLDEIEHDQIRNNFAEPRIHFAVVCAAESCPILRKEVYTGEKLEAQLADQTTYVHTHPRWYVYDAASNTLRVTKLYQWYGGDFEKSAGSVLKYIAQQRPEIQKKIDAGEAPTLEFLDYSWELNDIRNR